MDVQENVRAALAAQKDQIAAAEQAIAAIQDACRHPARRRVAMIIEDTRLIGYYCPDCEAQFGDEPGSPFCRSIRPGDNFLGRGQMAAMSATG